MTMPGVWVTWAGLVAVGALAWWLTGRLRQYALDRQMVDVPNARSSHQGAIPRGGGGAMVVAVTFGVAWWAASAGVAELWGVLVGGLIVATVGFVDDHRSVSPIIRLIGHTVAALIAVASLAGGAMAWTALCVFGIVWLINLTNFMDGIDGLAGAEVVTVCGVGAALQAWVLPGAGFWIEPAIVAVAAVGFLIWNWPPARIFMGDVGSGFVGFMMAVLALRAAEAAPALGWSWVILLGVFVSDATVTLVRRAVRGDRLFQAHRSHAYQHLAHAWGSHRAATALVVGINLCWLTPIAALVANHDVNGITGLIAAYVPVVAGVWWCGAGAGTPGVSR